MTFESLYIKSFGKLNGKRINFGEGVNIIEGANESGKSTICAFIQFIFYGLPSKTEEKLRSIISRKIICSRKNSWWILKKRRTSYRT